MKEGNTPGTRMQHLIAANNIQPQLIATTKESNAIIVNRPNDHGKKQVNFESAV